MATCYQTTGLACAGGTRLQALLLLPGSTVTHTVDHRAEFVAVLPADVAALLFGGVVLELVDDVDMSSEWVVRRQSTGFGLAVGTVWCDPVPVLLATTPPVRAVSNGRATTLITASLTPTQWLTGYLLQNLAADGLSWLSLGIIEPQDVVTLTLDAVSRLGLLTALAQETRCTWVLTRIGRSCYTVSLYETVPGATVDAVLGDDVTMLVDDEDNASSATSLVVLGADAGGVRANLSDAAFLLTVLTSTTGTLTDAKTGASAVVVAGQAAGWYLTDDLGHVAGPITANTPAGVCTIGTFGSIATGSIVQVQADGAGTPLLALTNPAAVSTYGKRTRIERMGFGRFRTILRDPSNLGAVQWSAVNTTTIPAVLPILRSDMGVTRVGSTNGARASSTGTGTPFALNFPVGTLVYQGDMLMVAGANYALSTDAVPDSSGNFTASLSSALVANYADNDSLTLTRSETRTVTLATTVSTFAPRVPLSAPGDGGLIPDNGTGQLGPRVWAGYLRDEVIAVDYDLIAYQTTGTFTTDGSLASGVTADTLTVGDDGSFPGGITTASVIRVPKNSDPTLGWDGFRFVSRTGTTSTWTRVSAGASGSVNCLTDLFSWSPVAIAYCDTNLTSGSTLTYTRVLDTRTVRCNGAASIGATSLALKGGAAVASHAWTSSDSISLRYGIPDQTITFTGGAYATAGPYDPAGTLWTVVLPFDTGGSTIKTVNAGDFVTGQAVCTIGTYPLAQVGWTLASVSGSTATFTAVLQVNPAYYPVYVNPSVAGATAIPGWTVIDTYPVGGSATFGSNARVTLSVTIPSDRSYLRNATVWANWHGDGAAGAAAQSATCLRLNANVSGSASSVVVLGDDAYTSAWDGSASLLLACYRVFASASAITTTGELLYAASNATTDGSGHASVTLTTANSTSISNGQRVIVTRPALVPVAELQAGYVYRLRYAAGSTPNNGMPAGELTPFTVRVSADQTRQVTVWVRVAHWNTYGSGGTAFLMPTTWLALWADGATGSAPLVAKNVPGYPTQSGLTVVTYQVTTTINRTTTFNARVYGGSTSDADEWAVLLDANAYADTDQTLSIMPQPQANAGWFYAQRALAARSVPLQTIALTRQQGGSLHKAWDQVAVVGTWLQVRAWQVLVQVTAVTTDLLTASRSTMVVSSDAQRATNALAQLAATVDQRASSIATAGATTTGTTMITTY